jgi:hypothetical protein
MLSLPERTCPILIAAIFSKSLKTAIKSFAQMNLTAKPVSFISSSESLAFISPFDLHDLNISSLTTLEYWGLMVTLDNTTSVGVRWDQYDCADALDEIVTSGGHYEETLDIFKQIKIAAKFKKSI